jgi:hypothetical protein
MQVAVKTRANLNALFIKNPLSSMQPARPAIGNAPPIANGKAKTVPRLLQISRQGNP